FVNMLPVRVEGSPELTFGELARRARARLLDALAHQDVPFEKIVERLNPPRDPATAPLVQVVVNSLPDLDAAPDFGPLAARVAGRPNAASKFDLTLYLRDRADGIELTLAYATALFSRATAEALLAQVELVIAQAVAAEGAIAVEQISLLREADLSRAAHPQAASRTVPSICERFSGWCQDTPHALAVEDVHARYSYARADELSNRIANLLIDRGVVAGDVVAVLGRRAAVLPIALLAIHKIGASFAVLDPSYPAQRLAALIDAAGAGVIIAIDEMASALRALTGGEARRRTIVTLPAAGLQEAVGDYSAASPQACARSPDYILFTSGTTGGAKVVASPLAAVAAFLAWQEQEFAIASDDRFTMLSGLSPDPLLRDPFAPLSLGASLHVPDESVLTNGELRSWICAARISRMHITPSLFASLTAQRGPDLNDLRSVFFGGEPLLAEHAAALFATAPGCE